MTPRGGTGQPEQRVLVLAVPDALDTAIALLPDSHGARPRFLSCADPVDGAVECTPCCGSEISTAARDVAAGYGPTHLVVRDGTGDHEALRRCRTFLQAALAGAWSTVQYVVQTHPRPGTASTHAYDAWLKQDPAVRDGRALNIVWHEPLTTTFVDCRGAVRQVDEQLAWKRTTSPVRTIARRLRDTSPHNLEYTTRCT